VAKLGLIPPHQAVRACKPALSVTDLFTKFKIGLFWLCHFNSCRERCQRTAYQAQWRGLWQSYCGGVLFAACISACIWPVLTQAAPPSPPNVRAGISLILFVCGLVAFLLVTLLTLATFRQLRQHSKAGHHGTVHGRPVSEKHPSASHGEPMSPSERRMSAV